MRGRRSHRLPKQEELRAAFELWYGSVLRAVETAAADRAIDVETMASETLATLLSAPGLTPEVEAAVMEGLSNYAEAHPSAGGLTLLHGLAAVADRLRRGLELADAQAGTAMVDPEVTSLRALLYARLRDLPVPGTVCRERASVSETSRWGLVDRFLQSPEAAGLVGAELLVRCAIDYKLDWADGDPLRWSPEVVADFLLDWLPRQEMLVATARTPAHLRAWVRFAGRLVGLHPAYIEATVAAVARVRDPALNPLGPTPA